MRRLHPTVGAALGARTAGDEGFYAARQALCTQTGDGMWGWMSHGGSNCERGRNSTIPVRRSMGQKVWFNARPMKWM